MDRNAILNQIVESASKELNVLAADGELQKVASSIQEENHKPQMPDAINEEEGLLHKVAEEPQLTPTEEQIVALLKKEAQELTKTASVVDDEELELLLEKTAMEAGLELVALEKTAEEFGKAAAHAFLRELGIEAEV